LLRGTALLELTQLLGGDADNALAIGIRNCT